MNLETKKYYKPLIDIEVRLYVAHHLKGFSLKCTQYGICGQAAFKNVRAIFWGIGRGR